MSWLQAGFPALLVGSLTSGSVTVSQHSCWHWLQACTKVHALLWNCPTQIAAHPSYSSFKQIPKTKAKTKKQTKKSNKLNPQCLELQGEKLFKSVLQSSVPDTNLNQVSKSKLFHRHFVFWKAIHLLFSH